MIEMRVAPAPWWDGVQFLLRQVREDRKVLIAGEIPFVEVTEGEARNPTGHFSLRQAQVLMDDLWACGVRPSEGTGSAGSLKATQGHLEDMRRIAFKRLGIPEFR